MTKVVKKRSKIGVVPSTLKKNQLKQRVRRGGVDKISKLNESLANEENKLTTTTDDSVKQGILIIIDQIKNEIVIEEAKLKAEGEGAADLQAEGEKEEVAETDLQAVAAVAAVGEKEKVEVEVAEAEADLQTSPATDAIPEVPVNGSSKDDVSTSGCIEKYKKAIKQLISDDTKEQLMSNDAPLQNINDLLFIKNKEKLDKYFLNLDITKITKNDANIDFDKSDFYKIMEEDIKYLLRGYAEDININYPYKKTYEHLYINSIHLLNVIHLINYNKDKDKTKSENILNLYKLQYEYYFLMCVKLRIKNKTIYNFIVSDKAESDKASVFVHEINDELTKIAFLQTKVGGKKLLSVNKIKEIADMLKVSHSKCKSKESIMNKIKSIDLQKLTIEQLKIYCKLFNIRGCSKCKSKKSLLLHTKSNMKVR